MKRTSLPLLQRRHFITLLGAAAAWPIAARAQQSKIVVGFLSPGSPEPSSFLVTAFREGLAEVGYIEGKNVTVEYRWARGQYDQLEFLAADLVGRHVTAIAATGGTISAQAAKAATSAIPIVFNVGDDPIKSGLVASFNRPGGNLTGVNTLSPALETKRLGLLRELVPQRGLVAVLLNPANPDVGPQKQDVSAAAKALGQELRFFYASNEKGLDASFAAIVQDRPDGLLLGNDVFFTNRREQIVSLAARHALPARFGGLQVDHQIKLDRLDDRQIGWAFSFNNTANVDADLMIDFDQVGAVAHQAATLGELAKGVDRSS
jgi:putative ABC transport system substrate-binding protein